MALPHVFSTLTGAQPPSKLDDCFNAVSGSTGALVNSTPSVVSLDALDRTGKPWVLSVAPGASSSILVESSTNGGSTYSAVAAVTSTAVFMGEAGDGVNRIRLTRNSGTSTGYWGLS